MVNRAYNDEDLSDIAIQEHGFSEYLVFKIVDSDTAYYMTGKVYHNSGVVIGIKDQNYAMLFVPKRLDDEAFIVMNTFNFNLDEIYLTVYGLEDSEGQALYDDPLGDYGGLSISIKPYQDLKQRYPNDHFDSQIIFTLTTDRSVLHIAYVDGEICVFSSSGERYN